MRRIIATFSGGKASAWCAAWAARHYGTEHLVLYHNDTKWEDADLYRFLGNVSSYIGVPITYDSDGRSPEDLFHANNALANNRMPFCSRILKAERLQKYYQHDDIIIFGVGPNERHRAERLKEVYDWVGEKRHAYAHLRFPLIEEDIQTADVDAWLASTGIAQPRLYDLGFTHNNCGGGCVRAGKSQWKHLLRTLPDVYRDRECVEIEMREATGKNISFLTGLTLTQLRESELSAPHLPLLFDADETECIGICDSL